ncbi:hypothetical protein [uncultured Devosia sp.]|uniref:hypothetical protein n=1 Tax=uncultured Devosia sp. TaxID=211434 RepID=UPI00262D75C3|nr:hypothetical protein [uncultured Devosia sp.]
MQIDRRITNGLAWAGALLVIAIPAADAALRLTGISDEPQIAVIEEQAPAALALPTAASERPQPVEVAEATEAEAPSVASEPAAGTDSVGTASVVPRVSGGDAVDAFVRSGRPMPSYISDGGASEPGETAVVSTPSDAPGQTAASPEPEVETAAAVSRTRIVTFPTPVSERPESVPRALAPQPPLVIQEPAAIVTSEDLEDWESGPLSEFLARRQGGTQQVAPDYDPDGFFLDEGPNSSAGVTRFPRAYGGDFYPFE